MRAASHCRMLALSLLAAIALTSSVRAETSIATRWKLIGQSQADCMVHAKLAITRLGFDNSDPGSQSMSGKRGDYTASIRCISEQNIVFFVTSGPSPEVAARYLAALYGTF